MIYKESVSISFDKNMLERLNKSVAERNRSQFVMSAVKEALDRLDVEVAHQRQHEKWITEKVVPALRIVLKKAGHDELLEMWSKGADFRAHLVPLLEGKGVVVKNDETIKAALDSILKDYDGY